MYADFETRTSFRYLKEVIQGLNDPICILGGWAVYFHVNGRFEKAQGRPYLGSRDIDLGFSMSGDMKDSALAKSLIILRDALGFQPLSFRFFKEIHTETGEEIRKGEIIPSHYIFPMYVDVVVDTIPAGFRQVFGFDPIDEPLLTFVFEKEECTTVKEFGRRILLPKPELLLAMKVHSLPNRDKEHKLVKDICDAFALAWYTDIRLDRLNLTAYVPKKDLSRCLKAITRKRIEEASALIGHDAGEIARVLSAVCGKS